MKKFIIGLIIAAILAGGVGYLITKSNENKKDSITSSVGTQKNVDKNNVSQVDSTNNGNNKNKTNNGEIENNQKNLANTKTVSSNNEKVETNSQNNKEVKSQSINNSSKVSSTSNRDNSSNGNKTGELNNSSSASSSNPSNSQDINSAIQNINKPVQAALNLKASTLAQIQKIEVTANQTEQNSQESQTSMNEAAGNIAEMWENEVDTVVSELENVLPQNEASVLKQDQVNWNNYSRIVLNAIYPSTQWYSLLPLQQATLMQQLSMNRVFYLMNNYMTDNGINPQFTDGFASEYLSGFTGTENIPNYVVACQNIQEQGNQIIANAKANNTSMLEAYNQVYNIWNNELNEIYQYIVANSGGSLNAQNLKSAEVAWVNLKEERLGLIGSEYSGEEQSLAVAKAKVRATQLQCYNLMRNFSAYVGIHY